MTYDSRQRTTASRTPTSPERSATASRRTTRPPATPWPRPSPTPQRRAPHRTVTTVVDLLGQVRSHTDAWGKTATTTYRTVGRPTTVDSPVGTQTFTFNNDGTDGPTVLDSTTYATPHYDSAGRLSYVEYADGTKSDTISRDAYGRQTTSLWRKPRTAQSTHPEPSPCRSAATSPKTSPMATTTPECARLPLRPGRTADRRLDHHPGLIGHHRLPAHGVRVRDGERLLPGTYQSAAGKNTNQQ